MHNIIVFIDSLTSYASNFIIILCLTKLGRDFPLFLSVLRWHGINHRMHSIMHVILWYCHAINCMMNPTLRMRSVSRTHMCCMPSARIFKQNRVLSMCSCVERGCYAFGSCEACAFRRFFDHDHAQQNAERAEHSFKQLPLIFVHVFQIVRSRWKKRTFSIIAQWFVLLILNVYD